MSLSDLYTTLQTTGVPVAYEAFPNNQALPCITYNVAYSNNFGADSMVYKKILHIDIFLYTATKDTAKEKLVEDALDGVSLFYNKTESYIYEEKAFQIIYEVEIDG